jgi:hypothetical protein
VVKVPSTIAILPLDPELNGHKLLNNRTLCGGRDCANLQPSGEHLPLGGYSREYDNYVFRQKPSAPRRAFQNGEMGIRIDW